MRSRATYRLTDPAQLAGATNHQTVLDVREDDEWQAGHIEGAVHIPMGQLSRRLGELDPRRPIVAVCRSGRRSGQVAAALTRRGFDVANLEGGLQAWARAGLPLTAADGTAGQVV